MSQHFCALPDNNSTNRCLLSLPDFTFQSKELWNKWSPPHTGHVVSKQKMIGYNYRFLPINSSILKIILIDFYRFFQNFTLLNLGHAVPRKTESSGIPPLLCSVLESAQVWYSRFKFTACIYIISFQHLQLYLLTVWQHVVTV